MTRASVSSIFIATAYDILRFSTISEICGGGRKAPQNANDIRREQTWGNKFIQTSGKTLFYTNWEKSGINFIDDLLDENGKFKSGDQIFQSLGGRTNWIIEYKTILKAIPKLWKEKLKNCNMSTKVKKEIKPFMEIDKKKYI